MSEKRQFIAGATCPECGQLDKVQRVDNGTRVWVECVRCGMQKPLDEPPSPRDDTVQTVQLQAPIDPKKLH